MQGRGIYCVSRSSPPPHSTFEIHLFCEGKMFLHQKDAFLWCFISFFMQFSPFSFLPLYVLKWSLIANYVLNFTLSIRLCTSIWSWLRLSPRRTGSGSNLFEPNRGYMGIMQNTKVGGGGGKRELPLTKKIIMEI